MKKQLSKKSQHISLLLNNFKQDLLAVYHEKLLGVILFGSYARGDFHSDSDVDLLLLFPEDTQINKETKIVMDIAYNFMFEDGYLLMPILTTATLFEQKNNPLYNNIKKEGIII